MKGMFANQASPTPTKEAPKPSAPAVAPLIAPSDSTKEIPASQPVKSEPPAASPSPALSVTSPEPTPAMAQPLGPISAEEPSAESVLVAATVETQAVVEAPLVNSLPLAAAAEEAQATTPIVERSRTAAAAAATKPAPAQKQSFDPVRALTVLVASLAATGVCGILGAGQRILPAGGIEQVIAYLAIFAVSFAMLWISGFAGKQGESVTPSPA